MVIFHRRTPVYVADTVYGRCEPIRYIHISTIRYIHNYTYTVGRQVGTGYVYGVFSDLYMDMTMPGLQ